MATRPDDNTQFTGDRTLAQAALIFAAAAFGVPFIVAWLS